MNHKTIKLGAYLLGVAVVAALIWFGYIYAQRGSVPLPSWLKNFGKREMSSEKYQQNLSEALSAQASRNYDVSIEGFERLLETPTTPSGDAHIKVRLGINLLGRGFERDALEDTKRGMDLLWSVVLDSAVDPKLRAVTLTDLAYIYILQSNSFYIQNTPYPPFNTLVKDGDQPSSHLKAADKLLAYADEIYPNAYTKYYIAGNLTTLVANKALEDGVTEKEAAELMQRHVLEGDAAYAADSTYSEATKVRMMLERAKGIGFSGGILKNRTQEEREAGYRAALDVALASNRNDAYVIDAEMETRFWYAGLIAAVDGSKRSREIVDIVAPFAPSVTPPSMYRVTRAMFVRWGESQPYTNFGQQRALLIAKESSAFREMLLSAGWTL